MKLIIIIAILVFHFIGDYLLQTDEMAAKKYKSNLMLAKHVGAYCVAWAIPAYFLFSFAFSKALLFLLITFVAHSAQDYSTSRWAHRLQIAEAHHKRAVVMGLDQLLHYLQLMLTYLIIAAW